MAEQLQVTSRLAVPLDDIQLTAIRAQGAGGQNVNKVASAIHLRFDSANCAALSGDIKERLLRLGDSRITADGVIVIKAQNFRTRERNRREALDRLSELLRSAAVVVRPRKKSKLPKRAREQRLDAKRKRSQVKRSRGRVDDQ